MALDKNAQNFRITKPARLTACATPIGHHNLVSCYKAYKWLAYLAFTLDRRSHPLRHLVDIGVPKLERGVVEMIDHTIQNNCFVVQKKDSGFCPALDLTRLNWFFP